MRGNTFGRLSRAWLATGLIGALLALLAAPAAADTERPSIPTGLTIERSGATLVLTWTAASDNVEVVEYKIYSAPADGIAGTELATSLTPTFRVEAPVDGDWYYIRAVDSSGNVGWRTGSRSAGIDRQRPTIPANITIRRALGANTIVWTPSSDDVGVEGYNVYRATSATEVGVLLGSSLVPLWVDAAAPDDAWYYLKAVDTSGNESWRTGYHKAVPLLADRVLPGRPSGIIVVPTGPTTVGLSWRAGSDNVGVAGYNVYRGATSDPAAAELIATTELLSYIDTTATPGTTHWYFLRTVDTSSNVSWRTGQRTATTPQSSGIQIVTAGDFVTCDTDEGIETARLLDLLPGEFLGLGDFVYPDGTIEAFNECYDPLFGPFLERTLPVPGNHEYNDTGASGYFEYFGFARAGTAEKPWYSTTRGNWQIIALDSNCWNIGSCRAGSPQYEWLKAELEAAPDACRLVAMHHPYQSSWSPYDNSLFLEPMMSLLTEHGTDIVLTGHSHHYERFAQQTSAQVLDDVGGYRQFTVGTGGVAPRIPTGDAVNSEVVLAGVHGLLDLDLFENRYTFRFFTTTGATADFGGDVCVNA